jgi:transmembrane sensor
MPLDREILDMATLWAVRTQEPSFEDWPAFTAWLEQSPAHSEAYDRVMLAAEEGAEVLPLEPANGEAPERMAGNRRWLMPALAACLAVIGALWVWQTQSQMDVYRTAPGETRAIALADGSTIVMSGGTQLVIDRDHARQARLAQGQALFEIRHDQRNPFTLEVGEATLVDAGTIFDVAIRSERISVGVSEGAVIFNPTRQNARVEPGELLTFAVKGAGYDVARVPLDQVGEWRTGRLTFRDASLKDVAADVSRATGIVFEVAEGANLRPINGSVTVDVLRNDPDSLGPLLGISVRRQGDSWILASPK